MNITLISITPNPEKHIEYCGRFCYDSLVRITDDSCKRFIESIMKNGHLSVIEHASATFQIEDVSRALTHQLVRHRHLSFSQQSQRFAKLNKPFFVTPPTVKNLKIQPLYEGLIEGIVQSYECLKKVGLIQEDARYVLPNATKTNIAVSGNFRCWFEMLQKRLDKHAQWEFKELASRIFGILRENAPNIFNQENLNHGPPININWDEVENTISLVKMEEVSPEGEQYVPRA